MTSTPTGIHALRAADIPRVVEECDACARVVTPQLMSAWESQQERWGFCGLRRASTWAVWTVVGLRHIHLAIVHADQPCDGLRLLQCLPEGIPGLRVADALASRTEHHCAHPASALLEQAGFRSTGDVGLHPLMRWELSTIAGWGRRLAESVERWRPQVQVAGEAVRTGTGTAASPR